MTIPLLTIKDLSFGYTGNESVFKGFSLTVGKGETCGLIGANGTGKSTLLLLICGLLQGQGEICLEGQVLEKANAAAFRRRLSMVFQNPDDQLFMPTIFEDVAFGLDQFGWDEETVRRTVRTSLDGVGITLDWSQSSQQLSLGQKKRVCLAAALARKAPLMLLDEPTNELDPKGRRELLRSLDEIDATKLIVTHDLDLVATHCDRVCLLGKGGLIAEGKPSEIMTQEALMEAHDLEVPLTFKMV